MHKPERQNLAGDNAKNQAETGSTAQAIYDNMNRTEFTPEQLPELWQQITEDGDIPADRARAWNNGVEAMYRRCETYPQHVKLARTLSGMQYSAWHTPSWDTQQAAELLRRATTAQIQQTLTYEQHHPSGWWSVSKHLLAWSTVGQLTGRIIEQLDWDSRTAAWAATAAWATPRTDGGADRDRWWHIRGHIQQQLLEGDKHAWDVFLGIIEPGHSIGETAELAKAIEQQTRPVQ